MLSAIAGAKESIYLSMYIFRHDTPAHDFLSELERKAAEGVRVIIVLDAVGSFGLEALVMDRLRIAGAEVRFFSYWFRRLHQKVLIIDEHIAFLGGVNISHRYALWGDLQVRMEGKIVRYALSSFGKMYRESGGRNPALAQIYRLPFLARSRLWFIEHGLSGKRSVLRAHYEKHIDRSERSIVLVTPYFIPHRWLVAHLHQAILRGVAVEIIVPRETEYWFVTHANYHYVRVLSSLGARCLLYDQMNHAKAMLVDGKMGTVGSQNIDALSFDWNAEAGIFFEETRMVHDLTKIIDNWRKDTVLFDPKQHPPHRYDHALAFMVRLFQPIL